MQVLGVRFCFELRVCRRLESHKMDGAADTQLVLLRRHHVFLRARWLITVCCAFVNVEVSTKVCVATLAAAAVASAASATTTCVCAHVVCVCVMPLPRHCTDLFEKNALSLPQTSGSVLLARHSEAIHVHVLQQRLPTVSFSNGCVPRSAIRRDALHMWHSYSSAWVVRGLSWGFLSFLTLLVGCKHCNWGTY